MWTGIFLVIVGAVLLASKAGFPIPGWLLSWEVFVIALGLLIGIRHKFRNPTWIILVFIGSASFIDNFYPDLNIRRYIWPAAIILLGVFFILRPKKNSGFGAPWRRHRSEADNEWRNGFQSDNPVEMSSEQVVNITAIMGEVKRKMVTKSFRGGDITAFFWWGRNRPFGGRYRIDRAA